MVQEENIKSIGSSVEFTGKAMGGVFVYKFFPQPYYSKSELKDLFELAHQEVKRIESKFTEFQESFLTHINERAFEEEIIIDEETAYLFTKAREYSMISEGAFDITFRSPINIKADYNDILFCPNQKTLRFRKRELKVSFGGIGKGHAVDCAFDLLRSKGVVNFSVNGSGDMRVHSTKDAPRPWKIGIRNPFSKDPERSAGLVQIKEGSVSTSGTYIQGDHILRKDWELNSLVSATIQSESCMDSDVWGTICLALDKNTALKLLNDQGIWGVLIDKEGKTLLSERAMKGFGK